MIDFSRHHLENGLTVLLHEDITTPLVTINILYKVGSRNEEDGKTGLAHFQEHLLFTGSKEFPDFDAVLQQFGGQNNAFTNTDVTNYYMTIPKQCLDLGLSIEADRMNNLNFDAEAFRVQQGVVVEEFRQRYANPPYGDAWHLLREMVYTRDSYQWPTIGRTTSEIETFTISDARSFYERFYHPGNAILAVGGPVDKKEVLGKIERYFGAIQCGPTVEETLFQPGEISQPQLKTLKRKVPHDALYIAWPFPDRLHDDYYTGELLADMLTSGFSSRMFADLVQGTGTFERVESFVLSQNKGSLFVIYGVPAKSGAKPEMLVDEIQEALNRYALQGFGEKELLKVKRKTMSALSFGELEVPTKVLNLCLMEGLGDANIANQEREKYDQVQLADATRVINAHLQPATRCGLYYQQQIEEGVHG